MENEGQKKKVRNALFSIALVVIALGLLSSCSCSQEPSSFDWRDHEGGDWLTPGKHQGLCGCCWAFAAVGAMEAHINIAHDNPNLDIDLSEQEMVSRCCMWGGCWGLANPYMIFGGPGCRPYLTELGLVTESDIPFPEEGSQYASSKPCLRSKVPDDKAWVLKDAADFITFVSRDKLKDTLREEGPIWKCFPMPLYQEFQSGKAELDENDVLHCPGDIPIYPNTHCVVLVGYNDDGEYWIAKNSWGTKWPSPWDDYDGDGNVIATHHEGAYFKIGYGECGIEENLFGVLPTTASLGDVVPLVPPTRVPISMSQQLKGLWNKYRKVTANVQVIDEYSGDPVAGAKVYGKWGGILSGSVSRVTNSKGKVSFSTTTKRSGTAVFTVGRVETEDGRRCKLVGPTSKSIYVPPSQTKQRSSVFSLLRRSSSSRDRDRQIGWWRFRH